MRIPEYIEAVAEIVSEQPSILARRYRSQFTLNFRKDLDYFLWGAVKEKCFADKLETIEHLKANIRDAITEIRHHHSKKCTKIGPIK